MTNLKVSVCPRRSTLFLALFSITYSWDFLSSPSRTIQAFCVVPAFCLSLVRKVSSNAMKKKKEIGVEPQPSFTFTITVIFLGLCKVVNFLHWTNLCFNGHLSLLFEPNFRDFNKCNLQVWLLFSDSKRIATLHL